MTILERDERGRIVRSNGTPGGRAPRLCPGCGTLFPVADRTNRVYCSAACLPSMAGVGHLPADVDMDTSWTVQSACYGTDPALFFPERGEPTEPAKRVCRTCPVQAECLEYALATGEKLGIWGGKSERERRAIRRQRREGQEVA